MARNLERLRRQKIDGVIDVLRSEKVLIVANNIVHPIRRQTSRILAILDSPMLSKDPIVEKVRRLTL